MKQPREKKEEPKWIVWYCKECDTVIYQASQSDVNKHMITHKVSSQKESEYKFDRKLKAYFKLNGDSHFNRQGLIKTKKKEQEERHREFLCCDCIHKDIIKRVCTQTIEEIKKKIILLKNTPKIIHGRQCELGKRPCGILHPKHNLADRCETYSQDLNDVLLALEKMNEEKV